MQNHTDRSLRDPLHFHFYRVSGLNGLGDSEVSEWRRLGRSGSSSENRCCEAEYSKKQDCWFHRIIGLPCITPPNRKPLQNRSTIHASDRNLSRIFWSEKPILLNAGLLRFWPARPHIPC